MARARQMQLEPLLTAPSRSRHKPRDDESSPPRTNAPSPNGGGNQEKKSLKKARTLPPKKIRSTSIDTEPLESPMAGASLNPPPLPLEAAAPPPPPAPPTSPTNKPLFSPSPASPPNKLLHRRRVSSPRPTKNKNWSEIHTFVSPSFLAGPTCHWDTCAARLTTRWGHGVSGGGRLLGAHRRVVLGAPCVDGYEFLTANSDRFPGPTPQPAKAEGGWAPPHLLKSWAPGAGAGHGFLLIGRAAPCLLRSWISPPTAPHALFLLQSSCVVVARAGVTDLALAEDGSKNKQGDAQQSSFVGMQQPAATHATKLLEMGARRVDRAGGEHARTHAASHAEDAWRRWSMAHARGSAFCRQPQLVTRVQKTEPVGQTADRRRAVWAVSRPAWTFYKGLPDCRCRHSGSSSHDAHHHASMTLKAWWQLAWPAVAHQSWDGPAADVRVNGGGRSLCLQRKHQQIACPFLASSAPASSSSRLAAACTNNASAAVATTMTRREPNSAATYPGALRLTERHV
nr:unnamed protein product [Digitaria exilis]